MTIFDSSLEEHEFPFPEPLTRDPPPAAPYPIDALGEYLGGAAEAIHDIVGAPVEIGAQSILATASLAAQQLIRLRLPHGDDQTKPISLYMLTIAKSGERKNSCDSEAAKPVKAFEAELVDE